ncbi:MAG: hypothetical protein B6D41_22175 [Chloroflexi bacterium UTCFX4]|nr:MAG: hypothetical protein B6D41_22175 [Chloroflexi bacterium UTCFX4]
MFAQPAAAVPQVSVPPQAINAPRASFGKRALQILERVGYFIGRGLTLGGRAAYADLFNPSERARGQVLTIDRQMIPARVELGFILWCLAWIAFGLLLLLPSVWGIASFALIFLVLLALSLTGWRFLGFSRSSANAIFQFMRRRFKRGAQLETRLTVNTPQGHKTVFVRGEFQGTMQQVVNGKNKIVAFNDANKTLAVNHLVRVWGLNQGKTLRAWKLEFLEVNGTPARVWLTAPRVVPLTAALFIPLVFWFIIRIVLLFVSR